MLPAPNMDHFISLRLENKESNLFRHDGFPLLYFPAFHPYRRRVGIKESGPIIMPFYLLGQGGRKHSFDVEDFDAVISLATHAMAGTPEAILEHTNSSTGWQNFWLNGRKTGEIGMMVYVAGERGIPMIMVSGDDKACREAEELVPGIVTACVKWGLACEGGRLLSAQRAHSLLTEKAAEAVRKIPQIRPVALEPPITARLEVVSRGRLPVRGEKPYVKIIDGRTYEVTGDTVQEAIARL